MANVFANFSGIIIPVVIFYIVAQGIFSKIKVYEEFIEGAKDGLKTVVQILPTLVGLMAGVGVLRASGAWQAAWRRDGAYRHSGGHCAPCTGEDVFFFGGNRTGAGYFQDPRHGFLHRHAHFHSDELHGNDFLHHVRVFSGGKGN